MPTCTEPRLVVFRDGFSAEWPLVARLLELEARGARLELIPDGRLRVSPRDVLTDDDRAFLRDHREEARRIVAYAARIAERPL